MKKFFNQHMNSIKLAILCTFFSFFITEKPVIAQNINFNSATLKGDFNLHIPTSLQFGPDDKLYVARRDGWIYAYTIEKNNDGDYVAVGKETIDLIRAIPNHNDDGSLNSGVEGRQITGILVKGTPDNPVLYVSNSDPRMGAGDEGDINLDTNSGIISKLTKNGNTWSKIDLVRGIPRSEENHAVNGLQIDDQTNTMYVAVGGFTNAGAPSKLFAYSSESALAACILSIDLNAVEAMPTEGSGANAYKYDLPTLDDPSRNNDGGKDVNDPWGGNDGLNQAKLDPNGPVQIFARGIRNPYDIVITESRQLYSTDNGANQDWGGFQSPSSPGAVTNEYDPNEPGSTGANGVNNNDGLHYIGHLDNYTSGSYYGGHPCPIRANPSGAGLYTHSGALGDLSNAQWRTSKSGAKPLPSDWPPIPENMANPKEGKYVHPGTAESPVLLTWPSASINGITEYTASNFNGALKGNLLVTNYNHGHIHLIKRNGAGDDVLNAKGSTKLDQDSPFISGFEGSHLLDVTAVGDNGKFPGTIWAVGYGSDNVYVFEPGDDVNCTADNSDDLDDDNDCFSNSDEIANSTNPCNASSKPSDFNKNCVSDLNDPDDDSDNINDEIDYFARDATNGDTTTIPVNRPMYNEDPGTGFYGLGFTGLMTNGNTNYLEMMDPGRYIAGGAAGAFTIKNVQPGDAYGSQNDQKDAFQFGVNVSASSGIFTIQTNMMAPFFNSDPQPGQSQGLYIGPGDQDNFLKLALVGTGLEIVYEVDGKPKGQFFDADLPKNIARLYLQVDPAEGTVQAAYEFDDKGIKKVGPIIQLHGPVLEHLQNEKKALAVGIIATSASSQVPFGATWASMKVFHEGVVTSNPNMKIVENNIKAYPNPFSQIFRIKGDDHAIMNRVRFMFYNNVGQAVNNIKLFRINDTEYEANFSEVPKGIYFLKILSPDGEIIKDIKLMNK